jgi:hypothetical protein
MELVDGAPLLDWLGAGDARSASSGVETRDALDAPAATATLDRMLREARPARRSVADPARVRAAFLQLAEGVHALHLSGKLHRDLKSQNVLVDRAGRVVLLDFGLVHELGRGARDAVDAEVVGTPLYMAPEQSTGAPLDESADWYAVGVALYRALTGAYPYDGRALEVMLAKQTRDPAPPCVLSPEVPADLDLLCRDLLRRQARARPSGREVLARLGEGARGAVALVSAAGVADRFFVGRHVELDRLRDGFADVLRGRARAFLVSGGSGVGKSALVRALLAELRMHRPDVVVLEGRCYASESLPYKALDAVIDDLARLLARLPDGALREVLPTDLAWLAQVFPVLRRVPAIDDAAAVGSSVGDPVERRRRALDALRGLLARLAARAPLVVSIDDLQWGDTDSALALQRILAPPDAPAILFVGTCRDDELETSAFFRAGAVGAGAVGASAVGAGARALFVELRLGPLPEAEALALARAALRSRGVADTDDRALALVGDAAGSPLFLEQLVEALEPGMPSDAVASSDARVDARPVGGPSLGSPARGAEEGRAAPTFGDVLERRLASLPADARRVLDVLALAAQPTDARVVRAAAGVDSLEGAGLLRLRASRLVRERATSDGALLEPYHDRIREALAARLDDAARIATHAALAAAYGARPGADPEVIARHLRGAGDTRGALGYLVRAADRASSALAFDHAAQLLRQALELADPAVDPVPALRERLGDALRAAGRGAEAAEVFLQAARDERDRGRNLDLRRRAAEQLLYSGRVDRGLAEIDGLLRSVGLALPRTAARALAEFALRRAEVRLRGIERRPEPARGGDDELALDLCWTLTIGLAMTDPVRAGVFQAQHLLRARRSSDLTRYALALAVEIPFSATAGPGARERTATLTRLARAAAEEAGDPRLDGFLASSIAGAAWLEGRLRDALQTGLRADALLRAHSAGAAWQAWQLDATAIVVCDCLLRLGRFAELERHVAQRLSDARARGDLFLELYLSTRFLPALRLCGPAPGDVSAEAERAAARWGGERFTVLHFWALCSGVEHALHKSDAARAAQLCRDGAAGVRASLLLQLQIYRATWLELEGRTQLALAAISAGEGRAAALRRARALQRALAREDAGWVGAVSALLDAGVRSVALDRRGAREALAAAERDAGRAGRPSTEARAGPRRAQLDGDDRALEAAHAALAALGVEDPSALVERTAPGRYA